MPLQIRRGLEVERLAMTQPLAAGELLWITDDQRLYIGNGSTLPSSLVSVTGYTDQNAQDAAASLFTSGTHTGINFTYNNGTHTIDAVVDFSQFTGSLVADSVKGSVFADDSTILVDGVSGRIVGPVFANVTGDVTGNVTGNLQGNVTGNLLGNTTGYHTGDVKGSVFADDSTLLVDSVGGKIVGPINSFDGANSITMGAGGVVIGGTGGASVIGAAGAAVWIGAGPSGSTSGTITIGHGTNSVVVNGTLSATLSGNVTGNLQGNVTGDVRGSLKTAAGASVIDTTTKAATLASIALESTGLITGSAMTVTIPTVAFATDSTNTSSPFVNFFNAQGAGPGASPVSLTRSRGSLLSPTSVQSGDTIGSIVGSGFSGSNFTKSAELNIVVDGVVSSGVVPSKLEIGVANSTGSVITTLTVKSTSVDFVAPPRLPVVADDTARSTLIPTPLQGMMIFMQAGTAPAATNVAQVYDGSNWINL